LEHAGHRVKRDRLTGFPYQADVIYHHGNQSGKRQTCSVKVDTGYCTLELALPPSLTVFQIQRDMEKLAEILFPLLRKYDMHPISYGIQPHTPPSKSLLTLIPRHQLPIPESRARILNNAKDAYLFTITAANHCHISTSRDKVLRASNLLNTISGIQIALTANSHFWLGRPDKSFKAVRNHFWDIGFPERHNQTGIHKVCPDFESYAALLTRLRPRTISRFGTDLYVGHYNDFSDYFSRATAFAKNIRNEYIPISPNLDDLVTHSSFAWYEARPSLKHGTVESRASCCQPNGENLAVCAFVLGILENLNESERIATTLMPRRQPLREAAQARGALIFSKNSYLSETAYSLLTASKMGLEVRGFGEAIFLNPLFETFKSMRDPATRLSKRMEHIGAKQALLERSVLKSGF
jgi:gamma-glutamylcysteine synthetase